LLELVRQAKVPRWGSYDDSIGVLKALDRVWLSCWTNRHEYAKTNCQDLILMAGGLMNAQDGD